MTRRAGRVHQCSCSDSASRRVNELRKSDAVAQHTFLARLPPLSSTRARLSAADERMSAPNTPIRPRARQPQSVRGDAATPDQQQSRRAALSPRSTATASPQSKDVGSRGATTHCILTCCPDPQSKRHSQRSGTAELRSPNHPTRLPHLVPPARVGMHSRRLSSSALLPTGSPRSMLNKQKWTPR